jgi:hypothetical protein
MWEAIMQRAPAVGGTLAVVLAICAVAASSASATQLTLTEGAVTLAPGDVFETFGFPGFDTENLFIETSDGLIECSEPQRDTDLEVAVVSNSRARDELKIDQQSGGPEEACRSFTGNAFASASIGGPIKLGANGKATAGGAGASVVFEHITIDRGTPSEREFEGFECDYAAGKLRGTNSASATSGPLRIELGGKLKLDGASFGLKHACPTASIELELPQTESDERGFGVIEEHTSG